MFTTEYSVKEKIKLQVIKPKLTYYLILFNNVFT